MVLSVFVKYLCILYYHKCKVMKVVLIKVIIGRKKIIISCVLLSYTPSGPYYKKKLSF